LNIARCASTRASSCSRSSALLRCAVTSRHHRELPVVGHRDARGLDAEQPLVPADEHVLADRRRLTGLDEPDSLAHHAELRRVDEVVDVAADDLLERVSEQRERRRVRVEDPSVAHDGDRIGRALHEVADALLALPRLADDRDCAEHRAARIAPRAGVELEERAGAVAALCDDLFRARRAERHQRDGCPILPRERELGGLGTEEVRLSPTQQRLRHAVREHDLVVRVDDDRADRQA